MIIAELIIFWIGLFYFIKWAWKKLPGSPPGRGTGNPGYGPGRGCYFRDVPDSLRPDETHEPDPGDWL